jgi:hypothetical protein
MTIHDLSTVPACALTVRQPWAWAITTGLKTIENRGWRIPPGPCWLHAGARTRWDDDAADSPLIREAWELAGYPLAELNPDTTLIPFGAVTALITFIGAHHSIDCASECGLCDPWAAHGQVHNQLTVTRTLNQPVPCRGMPGLWPVPPHARASAAAQLPT